jgi:hypothetical protein
MWLLSRLTPYETTILRGWCQWKLWPTCMPSYRLLSIPMRHHLLHAPIALQQLALLTSAFSGVIRSGMYSMFPTRYVHCTPLSVLAQMTYLDTLSVSCKTIVKDYCPSRVTDPAGDFAIQLTVLFIVSPLRTPTQMWKEPWHVDRAVRSTPTQKFETDCDRDCKDWHTARVSSSSALALAKVAVNRLEKAIAFCVRVGL